MVGAITTQFDTNMSINTPQGLGRKTDKIMNNVQVIIIILDNDPHIALQMHIKKVKFFIQKFSKKGELFLLYGKVKLNIFM